LSSPANIPHVLESIQSFKPSAWGKLVTGIGKAIFPAPKENPAELLNYEPKPTAAETAFYAELDQLDQQERAPIIELANLRVEAQNAERAELAKSLAAKLNKPVDQVSEVDVAGELLARREEFVNSINLENTVLFSARYKLEILEKEAAAIKKLNPSAEALALLDHEIKEVQSEADNEMLVPIEVDADVFDGVKNNLFPSYKGITATQFLGMLGGTTKAQRPTEEDLFFNDTFKYNAMDPFLSISEAQKKHAVEAVNTLLAGNQPSFNEVAADIKSTLAAADVEPMSDQPDKDLNRLQRRMAKPATYVIDLDELRTKLAQQQSSLGLSELQVAYALHHATALKAKITHKTRKAASRMLGLGRAIKKGDLNPELRLAGLVPSSHFLLDRDARLHVAGNFTAQGENSVEFTTREFNAPTQFRVPEKPFTDHPTLSKNFQKTVVDFPTFESEGKALPNNPRELVVDMKIWKLFNYVFPNLTTPMDRLAFMEVYDISPGERTLEWTQSFPPPEHTFVEAPIIKEAEEPSEDGKHLPASWPKHHLAYTSTSNAKITITHDDHHHEVLVVSDIDNYDKKPEQVAAAKSH